MAFVSVKNFSCIKNAEIEIKRINVIIGPQGSGKSVITKLIYFLNDIVPNAVLRAEDGFSITELKKSVEKSFAIWFPPQAWGDKRFQINYTDGNFNARILRRQIGGKLSDEVTLKLSSWTEDTFTKSRAAFEQVTGSEEDLDLDTDFSTSNSIEVSSRVRAKIWSQISATSDTEIVRSQIFIPAGRAFFTSIGRLVAGIEHAGSLDPATLKFAKLFAAWRDRSNFMPRYMREQNIQSQRKKLMTDFFGGVVQSKRDAEFIEMEDGRKVPFSSLSSGQQELLPIWYFLDNIMSTDERLNTRHSRIIRRPAELVYIEEPEAHLFPRAQCDLLDILVSKVASDSVHRKMLITTHSPYIMARLNVLLKAGSLSRRKKKNKLLGDIVPRPAWINLKEFSAFKIEDGQIRSIVDEEEGLIDAAFLDEISDVISEDFGKLLDLEDDL